MEVDVKKALEFTLQDFLIPLPNGLMMWIPALGIHVVAAIDKYTRTTKSCGGKGTKGQWRGHSLKRRAPRPLP